MALLAKIIPVERFLLRDAQKGFQVGWSVNFR